MAKRPGGVMVQGPEATKSQLIPVLTKWEDIGRKAQMWPAAVFCIAAFFLLEILDPSDVIIIPTFDQGQLLVPQLWVFTSWYLIVLALFLTMASLFFIDRQVGKHKSWWLMLGVMGFSAYFLWLFNTQGDFAWLYNFFHQDLAGGEPDPSQAIPQLFMRHLLGTGFFEEFTKAIPLFLLAWWTPRMSPPRRAQFGIEEPLDGILLGAASGGGFAIVETLGQYIPRVLGKIYVQSALADHHFTGENALRTAISQAGLQNVVQWVHDAATQIGTALCVPELLTRSIDLSFGHMAYSGYFGYFIGLAMLKPQQRWKILGIGLVSAALPHALWDTFAFKDMTLPSAAVAVLSYVILAAAILKAREISPNRNLLQPSVIFGAEVPGESRYTPSAARVPQVAVDPAPRREPQPPTWTPPPPALAEPRALEPPTGVAGHRLRVGTRYLIIAPGLRLLEHQVPGLTAQESGGAVAEVTRNPTDPSLLGLTNLSTTPWETVTGSGIRRQIESGKTIKLAPGTRIDFGQTDGEVV